MQYTLRMAKVKRPPNEQIGKRISQLMRSNPNLKTQTALAHATGIGQSTIGRILRGDVDTGSENIKQIAKALGTTLEYIMFGSITVVTNAFDQVRKVPLIEAKDASKWRQAIRDGETGNHSSWFACPAKCGPHTFAMQIKGDSASPVVNNGETVFVDPDAKQCHGCYVAIANRDGNHVAVKLLVIEADSAFAKTINLEMPGPKINQVEDSHVCGVVIGKWVSLNVC